MCRSFGRCIRLGLEGAQDPFVGVDLDVPGPSSKLSQLRARESTIVKRSSEPAVGHGKVILTEGSSPSILPCLCIQAIIFIGCAKTINLAKDTFLYHVLRCRPTSAAASGSWHCRRPPVGVAGLSLERDISKSRSARLVRDMSESRSARLVHQRLLAHRVQTPRAKALFRRTTRLLYRTSSAGVSRLETSYRRRDVAGSVTGPLFKATGTWRRTSRVQCAVLGDVRLCARQHMPVWPRRSRSRCVGSCTHDCVSRPADL
jgi:hypothetical protein